MKRSAKLYASVALMLVSLMMMASVTYAWFTLSTAPEVEGIKIAIGGDDTILIANDVIVKDKDGKEIHVPGFFSKNAELEVKEGILLNPVSTADGINWFIPAVGEDGQMDVSDLSKFEHDNQLKYANTEDGGYAYIDFWIVSPTDNTFLRISSGDASGEEVGSYVVEMPRAVKNSTNASGSSLDMSVDSLASSIRVGFLVDDTVISDNNVMLAYMDSELFREEMTALKGNFNEKSNYNFLIYEPNGLSHPQKGSSVYLDEKGLHTVHPLEGEYWVTRPIGLDSEDNVGFAEIPTKLIVQTESLWKINTKTGNYIIDEMYQAYLSQYANPTLDYFYKDYLQENFIQYVTPGNFFENTWDLYLKGNLQVTSQDEVSVLTQTNAVSGSYIVKLDKNVPQKIRMFVWIEGQDVDCSSNSADKTVSIRLEFAGSTGA